MARTKKRAKELRRQHDRQLRKLMVAAEDVMSRLPAPAPSPSRQAQEADGFRLLRAKLQHIAGERSEWAGIPMPIEGERLVVHPSYPYARGLSAIGAKDDQGKPTWKVRNTFWSTWRRSDIVVFEEASGKVTKGYVPGVHGLDKQLQTIGASFAWGVEQEEKALQLLASLVTANQLKQYMLTGSFLESSKRSGLIYMFRKLRPTVAIEADQKKDRTYVRCALCLHPIAYYENSWGGAMCPTDDVIAHLMLMRGDEPMFWRRANQHPAYRPESGL